MGGHDRREGRTWLLRPEDVHDAGLRIQSAMPAIKRPGGACVCPCVSWENFLGKKQQRGEVSNSTPHTTEEPTPAPRDSAVVRRCGADLIESYGISAPRYSERRSHLGEAPAPALLACWKAARRDASGRPIWHGLSLWCRRRVGCTHQLPLDTLKVQAQVGHKALTANTPAEWYRQAVSRNGPPLLTTGAMRCSTWAFLRDGPPWPRVLCARAMMSCDACSWSGCATGSITAPATAPRSVEARAADAHGERVGPIDGRRRA